MLELVSQVVAFVSQRYVDELKKEDKFSPENQKKAFQMAYDGVLQMIDEETQGFLTIMFGDLQTWLTTAIEQAVRDQRSDLPLVLDATQSDEPAKADNEPRQIGFGGESE